jgi:hypothetical protein
MKRMTVVPLHVVLAAAVLLVAGCSGGRDASSDVAALTTLAEVPDAPVAITAEAPEPSPSTAVDLEAFCALGKPMLIPVQPAHVGSDAHVAQFAALGEVAPDDLVDVIAALGHHYDVAVSPLDSDSQKYENFPASIQADAATLVTAIEDRCDAAV